MNGELFPTESSPPMSMEEYVLDTHRMVISMRSDLDRILRLIEDVFSQLEQARRNPMLAAFLPNMRNR